jgi:hypothetical protein
VSEAKVGDRLVDPRGRVIGHVDAAFVDYLLVRTRGILPVDLYVPRSNVEPLDGGRLRVNMNAKQAYEAWHRPLRKAPHD